MRDPRAESSDPPVADSRGRRLWPLALLAIGILACVLSVLVARGRDGLSNSDEAAYAEQADAILDGRPLTVGFVRHFHVRHPPDIVHPEDFYPPGNGALLALSWALFGRSDFASTLPSILIACLALPLLAYSLVRRLRASPPFAFACGVAMMFEPAFREHAYQGLADLPLTAAVVSAVVLALLRGTPTAIAAGIALAAGFWCKPAALLFAPGIALALAVAERQTWRRSALRIAAFALAFTAACAPWLWRNQQLYGDPLYSGNKHLTATANAPDFAPTDVRKVYWNVPPEELPTLADSIERFGAGPVVRRFLTHVWQVVVEHGPRVFGLWFVLAALALGRERRAGALLVVIGTYCLALSAVFAIYLRYLLPLLPIAAALAWTFGDRVARHLGPGAGLRWPFRGRWLALPARIALLAGTIVALPQALVLARDAATGRFEFEQADALRDAGRFARANLPPDARVMVQEALRFRYESGLLTVNTPFDAPEAIEAVVRHYGIDHIVQVSSGDFSEWSNRFLEPYLAEHAADWRRQETGDERFVVWRRTPR